MKFKVVVNGREYIVEVEEIEGEVSVKSVQKVETVVREEKPKEEIKTIEEKPKEEKPEAPKEVSGAGKLVKAPLPGKVTKVLVKPGDRVKSGDVLMYIEAMKMENEIVSPTEGQISRIFVKPGDIVESDQPLVEIG